MVEYDVQLPDGRTVTVEGQEGQEQQAIEFVRSQYESGAFDQESDRSLLGDTFSWLAGGDKDPNIEMLSGGGLAVTPEQSARLTALFASTQDDARLREGVRNIVPEVYFEKDAQGNDVAIVPTARDEAGNPTQFDKRYLNPKGLDLPTLLNIGSVTAGATGVAKGLKTLGLPSTGILGGALLGATEAGLFEGASSKLADQPYRPSEVVVGAAGGAIGEKFGGLISSMISRVGPNRSARQAVEDVLAENGVNVEGVDPALLRDMEIKVAQGADPEQIAIQAQSKMLPTEIPLTRGEVTGDAGRQIFEGEAEKGAEGEISRAMMEATRRQQQEAVGQNIEQIQQGLGGTPIQRGEGGSAAQEALVAQRAQAKQQADKFYDAARDKGAFLDPENGESIAQSIVGNLGQDFTPVTAPKAFSLADDLSKIMSEGRSIREVFDFRTKISNLSAEGGTESAAARSLLNNFDEVMVEVANNKMLYGDPESVASWLTAIGNYREFMQKWNTEGVLKNLTTETVRDGDLVLKVAPEEAANAILGTSTSGMPNKKNIARDLMTLKSNLPAEQWNQVRQEFFIRLSDMAQRSGVEGSFTGVTFRRSWNDIKKNRTLVTTMFSPEEIATIDAFANTVARIGAAAKNTSNTSAALSGIIPRLANMLGSTSPVQFASRLAVLRGIREAASATRLQAPQLQAPESQLRQIGAGLGATQTEAEDYDSLQQMIRGIAP